MCTDISQDFKYKDFIKFVEKSDFEETIKQEHAEIIKKQVHGTFTEARKYKNLTLNRYENPTCFDHTRVILPVEKKRGSYINANYVDGFDQIKKFICMQAPMSHTNYDLWRTVWMSHSRIIVMLCEKSIFNRVMYDAYWFHLEGYIKCRKFQITTKKIEVRPNYIKTTLLMTDGTEASQEVLHFAFTTWPDLDLPARVEDFLDFVLNVRHSDEEVKIKLKQEGSNFPNPPPIVVHSNRGTGRSGAFCAIYIEISRFDKTGIISLASTVFSIRKQRYNAVSNFTYYLFCYKVLACYVNLIGQPMYMSQKLTVILSLPLFKKWVYPLIFSSYNRDT